MDIKEIEHLAELSKLTFSEEELKQFSTEFESMVEFANIIKNCEVQSQAKINSINMADLREDEVTESAPVDVILQNAPMAKKDSFVVPRIME